MDWLNHISNGKFIENIYGETLELSDLTLYSLEMSLDADSVYLSFRTGKLPLSSPRRWKEEYKHISIKLRCQIIERISISNNHSMELCSVSIIDSMNAKLFEVAGLNVQISIRCSDIAVADIHPF